MIVRGVDIVNFRNIARAELRFSPTVNLVVGRNSEGKTNLLEAIHLFSLGRSFRTRDLDETVRFGEEYFFLRLAAESDAGVPFTVEAGYEREGRTKVSVNGKRAAGFAEIIGAIPSVIFVPEDVFLAGGAPAGRRTYLDYTAAQASAPFLREIKEFRGVLRRRNALLERAARSGVPPEGIHAWNEAFAAKGAAVARLRREIMTEVTVRAGRLLDEILGGGSGFGLEYLCSFDPSWEGPEEALREALSRAADAERKRGYTMAGPQYDDVRILLEGVDIRRYGSQGRKRLAALVLKLAQALTILEKRGERPVVILDDIFSELDREVAERVRAHLEGGYQSFITTPREDEIGALPPGGARFSVTAGVIVPAG